MVVLTDVTTPWTEFELGRTTSEFADLEIELDRVVPLGEDLLPYLWVRGDVDERAFVESVTGLDAVKACQPLEQVRGRTLFRVEWTRATTGFLPQLIANDATILEGYGRDPWFFRLRFPTRAALTDFYDGCEAAGVRVDVDRVYTLDEANGGTGADLTEEQYEILTMALHEGYFEVPRGATLGDLSKTLGISKQAASERLRRGLATALQDTL